MQCTSTNFLKRISVLFFILIIWCSKGISQTFIIGTGTNTNATTDYPAPYGNWYTGAKHQFLVLASELTASGVTTQRKIRSLAFDVAGVQGTALTDFTIKIGQTTATSLTTTYITGLTQVYSVPSYTEYLGWNTHTFSTPFTWNGTSNLVVEVCFDKYVSTYDYTLNAVTRYSTTSFNSSNVFYDDNGGVCSTSNGYVANQDRSNMKFLITTPITYDVVMNSIVSPTSWAVGTNTITVMAQNFGTTPLSSADFGYQLGASAPVLQSNVSISPARNDGQSYNHTFSTNLTIATAGTYSLKVWVRNPNNTGADPNTYNDTIYRSICTGIAGTYTINPLGGTGSTNFTTFTDAINKMVSCGVSGAVTFNVSSATYNEKVLIPEISGASAINKISFVGTDTSSCILTYASTGSADNYTLQLSGAKYISFKNIAIENTGLLSAFDYYFAVYLNKDANYNKFTGCKISVPVLSSNVYYYPIAIGICDGNYYTGTNAVYDTVLNSRIIGGYFGACYSANASNANNAIIGNVIEQYYFVGVTLYAGIGITFSDNTIRRPLPSASYALYLYNHSNYRVSRNIIEAPYYGIYMDYSSSLGSGYQVDNNIIYNVNSSDFYGIYGYAFGDFFNNTVYSNASTGCCVYFYSGSNCRFVNNILENTGSAGFVFNSSPSYHSALDYNNLYATGSNFAVFGATYLDLAALRAGNPSFNQKSVSSASPFMSKTLGALNLHLSASSPAATGTSAFLSTTLLDVDKEAHCTFAPSLGADESKFNSGTPVAGFTGPDTVFVNNPVVFLNNNPSTAPLGHLWSINGTSQGTTINLAYTFPVIGTYDVKIVSFGCFGVDSITRQIVVYNPTQVPIVDFIADINTVETYQSVQFTDLSTKGPTFWNWTFLPSAGVNYTNGTSNVSQHPKVNFTNPGLYQVCLWDSNLVGRSLSSCKVGYILVKATNLMCIFPFDTKVSSGTLYDDGGPNANYGSGGTCNFLIDPCASAINLTFSSFSLTGTSYLKIYNGTSNLAPALHTGLGFTGSTLPGGILGITASSGKMYIEFVKGSSGPGFAAAWTSVASSSPPPSGTLEFPDTVYDCGAYSTYRYLPSSLSFDRAGAYYSWYMDYANSPFPDAEGKGLFTGDWSYSTIGTYIIRCDIEGCGGTEIIYDTIYVDHPSTGPIVAFTADLLTATTTDVVNLTDHSTLDPYWWNWTISGPGSVTTVNGNASSKNYGVKFSNAGTYSVQLKDSNCVGSNTLLKTGYITIIEYCIPTVGTINPDFSIERFKFGRADTIINNTVYGLDYTNSSPAVGTVSYRDNTNKVTTYIINGVTVANKAVEAVVGLGETFNFNVKRQSNFNAANFKIWIDWNQDGIFQASELAATSGATSGTNFLGTITIPSYAQLGYTRLRIGTNFALLSNTPCGVNTFGDFNDFRLKITDDITPPVITITGQIDSVWVEVGRVFNDPGTSVTGATSVVHTGFAYGATVTAYPFLGVHTITASDASLNTSIKNIYVRATQDITLPVLSRIGADTVYTEVGSVYTDLGATASDFFFGSITSSITVTSTVNINKVGAYTVTYQVMDAAGNAAVSISRTVMVRDTQIPVITISGSNPLYISVFSTFNSPAATVADNYNNGLLYQVTGTVNTSILGTYQLFYNAKDSSGNSAVTKILTVIVRDVTAPQIILLQPDTFIIDCITLTAIPEPGYLLSDNYYPSTQLTVAKQGTLNLNVLGVYTIRYFVSDPSGNIDSSKSRIYKVVDRVAPLITLKGLSIMNWPRWKSFVDPGTTIYDKCDPSALVSPDYSKLDVNLDGIYQIVYSSTDASGNKAIAKERYVNVYTVLNGINHNGGNELFMVYPNPNNGVVTIALNIDKATQANLTIFDANGKLIYSDSEVNPMNNKIQLDLSRYAAGMYFIKLVTSNFSSSKTFSIQK